jgi:hypothetical protein
MFQTHQNKTLSTRIHPLLTFILSLFFGAIGMILLTSGNLALGSALFLGMWVGFLGTIFHIRAIAPT